MRAVSPKLVESAQGERITWCMTIGMLAKGTSGLGSESVSGRSRVPKPPTRIKAFIPMLVLFVERLWKIRRSSKQQRRLGQDLPCQCSASPPRARVLVSPTTSVI